MNLFRICLNCLLLNLAFLTGCKQSGVTPSAPASGDFNAAMDLLNNQPDSAFYHFNEIATHSKDSLEIASALNYMAIIQHNAGDYYGSIESLLSALNYLKHQSDENIAYYQSIYNLLGSNNLTLGNYVDAVVYYSKTVELVEDPYYKAVALNNLALAWQKQGDYPKAIELFRTIQQDSASTPENKARVLSNLARTRWLSDPSFNPLPDLKTALKIRKDSNDKCGLNASYSHLADYYFTPRPDSALFYAGNMYAIATELESVDDKLEALQKLIRLSAPIQAKQKMEEYMQLSDSLNTARTAARNQFALLRFEAEKTKAENLELISANAEKESRIFRQQILVGLAVIALVAIIIIGVNLQRRKKREYEEALRDNQLKTSQKVHDVVANGLYRIMTNIEHREDLDKTSLLDSIEQLYEQSRDISYEIPGKDPSVDLHIQQINELVSEFASEQTTIVIVGNESSFWQKLNKQSRANLEQLLQELLVNMDKHSDASRVLLRLETVAEGIHIHYSDDGIGMEPGQNFGNGLKNTENRILQLNGQIRFGQNQPSGLKIDIHLPC